MSDVIAQETTTLPEGPQISVFKTHTARSNGGITVSVKLRAYFNNVTIDMTVAEGVSAGSLKLYLELIINEITRRRSKLTTKPKWNYKHPKSITEFVESMGYNGMFLLDDATATTKTL